MTTELPGTLAPVLPAAEPRPAPEAPEPVPTAVAAGGGKVAIIIDDCGNSLNTEFIELPAPITLAVLPHVPYAREVAERGAEAGKGVILHLPMESADQRDPGPGTLRVDMSPQELEEQLDRDLDSVPGIVGVNNHQGSLASADTRVMESVLREVGERGLFYLDSRTTDRSVAPELAAKAGVRLLSRDVFIDNVDSVDAIIQQLQEAERVAAERGTALAIGHPRENTLAALRRWLPQARDKGIELVLLSELL